MPNSPQRDAAEEVVLRVAKCLGGCHDDALPRVDAQRVYILHIAHLGTRGCNIHWLLTAQPPCCTALLNYATIVEQTLSLRNALYSMCPWPETWSRNGGQHRDSLSRHGKRGSDY